LTVVIRAPKSILDLREAWDFIAADNESAADRIVSNLLRAGESSTNFRSSVARAKSREHANWW
jgi:plasmid stabilization system protein ParE